MGERTRERERGGVAPFFPQARKRTVLVWCCGEFLWLKKQSNRLFEGGSATGQDSYNSQGSRSMQATGSRFPSKSQAMVSCFKDEYTVTMSNASARNSLPFLP